MLFHTLGVSKQTPYVPVIDDLTVRDIYSWVVQQVRIIIYRGVVWRIKPRRGIGYF